MFFFFFINNHSIVSRKCFNWSDIEKMFVSINSNTTSATGGEGTVTLQEHNNSSPVGFFLFFCGVSVAKFLVVFCIVFCGTLFVFCFFLMAFVLSVILCMASA